jgi:hypothetical protein
MNQKGLFEVGAKLLGLYALGLVLPALLGITSMINSFLKYPKETDRFVISYLPLLATPILFAVFGAYLLKSRALADHVFSDETEGAPVSQLAEYFTIGIKLYGIYLVVGTISRFLQVLANLFFITTQQQQMAGLLHMNINIVSHLAVIAFGLALLFKGEILASWIYPFTEEQSAEEN